MAGLSEGAMLALAEETMRPFQACSAPRLQPYFGRRRPIPPGVYNSARARAVWGGGEGGTAGRGSFMGRV